MILLATGFITGWIFFENSTIDIKPHHIGFDLQWTNRHFATLPEGSVTLQDSIRNLNIQVDLNSNDAIKKTNGKYKNRVVFEFDGGRKIEQPQINGKKYALFRPASQGDEDSVVIKVYSDPILLDIYVDIVPQDYVVDEDMQTDLGWTTDSDSISGRITISHKTLIPFVGVDDSTRYEIQHEKNDSVFTIKLMPAKVNVSGKIKSPRQAVNIYSNNIGVEDDNPYYYYFIAFPSSKLSGSLRFAFNASDLTRPNDFNFSYAQNCHLQYNYVFPQPDIINNGYIEYHTPEKIEEIKKNHGLLIQAVDVKSLNHLNNLSFLYSVLVGTGLAFLIDVFIQLIKELRRVNRRHKDFEATKRKSN